MQQQLTNFIIKKVKTKMAIRQIQLRISSCIVGGGGGKG